jgi:hypothetical protein
MGGGRGTDGGIHSLVHQDTAVQGSRLVFLHNVGTHIPDYTVSQLNGILKTTSCIPLR